MKIKILFFLPIAAITIFFLQTSPVDAGNNHNLAGYAWSENIGWISFNSLNCDKNGNGRMDSGDGSIPDCPSMGTLVPDYGVNIDISTGAFSGYGWSDRIGWITFDSAVYGASPSLPNSTTLDWSTGVITGWARATEACKDNLWNGTRCTGSNPGNKAGNWDGWIKLKKMPGDLGSDYGVTLNPSTGEFSGYAWGGGGTVAEWDKTGVAGWISFNSKNCDPDGDGRSNGGTGCPPAGTGMSIYKVIWNNQPPIARNLTNTPISGCGNINYPIINFGWNFFDPDNNNPQRAYQVQIVSASNYLSSGFSSPDIDTCNPGPGTCAPGNSSNIFSPTTLVFDTVYYWRVKVWDSKGMPSPWAYPPSPASGPTPAPGNSFRTVAHRYPRPNFTHNPPIPSAGEKVIFTDSSTCYESDGSSHNCYTGVGVIYQWDFDITDGIIDCNGAVNPLCNAATVNHTFTLRGNYTTTLTITDPPVGTCFGTGDSPINTRLPLPKWHEIPPASIIFRILENIGAFIRNILR